MVVERETVNCKRPAYVEVTPTVGVLFVTILNIMTSIKNETAGKTAAKVFTFNENNKPVRVELVDGEPWFVAKDVCDALTIGNSRDAIGRLDDDEKGVSVVATPSGEQQMNIVNESGLYNLIFQSRKPEAKKFRKWVTSEVLPQIRKTGRYEANGSTPPRKYVRRTEPMTEDILNLLWLIGESLEVGDVTKVAIDLGVSRQSVQRVLRGTQRSARILTALYTLARQRREEAWVRVNPRLATELLLGNPVERPIANSLPSVNYPGWKGGKIGNQNARKYWNKKEE